MATLQIENFPDELYNCIQRLAVDKQPTINEMIIFLLNQAFEINQKRIDQIKQMPEVLRRIRDRPRINPMNFGLPDSTFLIQEDRNR